MFDEEKIHIFLNKRDATFLNLLCVLENEEEKTILIYCIALRHLKSSSNKLIKMKEKKSKTTAKITKK